MQKSEQQNAVLSLCLQNQQNRDTDKHVSVFPKELAVYLLLHQLKQGLWRCRPPAVSILPPVSQVLNRSLDGTTGAVLPVT